MLYRPFFIFACACSAQGVVVSRQQDGFTPSGKVDPSTIKDCTYWANVRPDDTCSSIARFWGLTSQDFIRFNPSLKGDCSGFNLGYSYCVEENSGLGRVDTSIAKLTSFAKTVLPKPTSPAPSPIQSGIISSCRDFYKVISGDGCQTIVDRYRTFTLSDFYAWNPAIGSNCLRLFLGYYVCVGIPSTPPAQPLAAATVSRPSPAQTGIRSDCRSYYRAVSGDTCNAIVGKFRTFTIAQFESWNPAVGSTCTTLIDGYYYCVAIPGTPTVPILPPRATQTLVATGPQPQQPGTVANCKKYYKVVAGDACYLIVQKEGIFAADFNRWNPGVGSDCQGLFLGFYVCVKV